MYGTVMPVLGGIYRFKMQPASPTVQWAIQQEQMRKNSVKQRSALRSYTGSFSDPVQGVSYELAGGVIMQFPATLVANTTYEGDDPL